jgi:hypothetical protein
MYHRDESIDKIFVRSGETDGTGSGVNLEEGGRATIIASVWAWGSGASDTADFFYAADASSPSWQYIGSVTPEQVVLKILWFLTIFRRALTRL